MASSTNPKLNIVFLGATGGSTIAVLTRALKDGHSCRALVRSPGKLTEMLNEHQISSDLIANHLSVVEGSCTSAAALTKILVINGVAADVIVSGVGAKPKFLPNPLRPTLETPNICENTTIALLDALRSLPAVITTPPKRPLLVTISTTGISDYGRDIPLGSVPLYEWLLPVPHRDKKAMEKLIVAESGKGDASAIGNFVVVRPSLLKDGPGQGFSSIREGAERDGKIDQRAIGYTISRDDVGAWIYEAVLENKDGKRDERLNKFIILTT